MSVVQVYVGRDMEALIAAARADGLTPAKWAAAVLRAALGTGAGVGPGRPETTTGDILARLEQGPATMHELVDTCGKRAETVEQKLKTLIAVGKVIKREKVTTVVIKSGQKLPSRVNYYGLPGAFDLDTQPQP